MYFVSGFQICFRYVCIEISAYFSLGKHFILNKTR